MTMASMATRSAAKRPANEAAQGLPHHRRTGERQSRAPQHGGNAGPPRDMKEQPGQNEEESASRKEVETAHGNRG